MYVMLPLGDFFFFFWVNRAIEIDYETSDKTELNHSYMVPTASRPTKRATSAEGWGGGGNGKLQNLKKVRHLS